MTVWENIYQKYKRDGEVYATLQPGLIPEFLDFIQKADVPAKRALDIGCGNGKYLVFLKSLGFEVCGIDSSPTAVELAKESLGNGAEILLADAYLDPFPGSSYGLVISIAAIHHGLKAQVRQAIGKIYNVLLPGGRFFVTLPDNEGSSHWTMMTDHQEIEPGTRIPLSGPERGLPHSSFTKEEIRAMFSSFSRLDMKLLADRGRWILTGEK